MLSQLQGGFCFGEMARFLYGEIVSLACCLADTSGILLLINPYYLSQQIEPGSQTEQAPPSSIFQLGPEDMHGFRFLTISVAPRPV